MAVQALPPTSGGTIHVDCGEHSSPWSGALWQPCVLPCLLMASVSQPVQKCRCFLYLVTCIVDLKEYNEFLCFMPW